MAARDDSTCTLGVVIATRDRDELLSRVLTPLLGDKSVDEVAVVDDGSTDGTAELLNRLQAQHERLQVVRTDPQARSGAQAARERGVMMLATDVVLLLDDDVIPAAGLAEGHKRHHARRDDLVVVGYMPVTAPPRRAGAAATILYARDYERRCDEYERDSDTILLHLWGGNVSLRREPCLAVGLRGPGGALGFHEDREFGLRCRAAGLVGRFDRSLRADHLHSRSLGRFLGQAREAGRTTMTIHRRHADAVGPWSPEAFERGLGAPLRAFVHLAARKRAFYVAARAVVVTIARMSARARVFPVELRATQLAQRIELARGAAEAERLSA